MTMPAETTLPWFGFLIPNGAFQCSQRLCTPNPIYDTLPYGNYLVHSNICQRETDFKLDPVSQTICCPSPRSCCPLSVFDCSSPAAELLDAANVSDAAIRHAWHEHFGYEHFDATLGREDPARYVCFASQWERGRRGVSGRGCASENYIWAMTNASTTRVRRIFHNAWLESSREQREAIGRIRRISDKARVAPASRRRLPCGGYC
jgi:hypothetical protein